jgi:feruloyl-CoA synthase
MAPRAPRFAPAGVRFERRADGSIVLRSPQALAPPARAVGEWVVQWAARAPDRTFLAERAGDGWRRLTYREVLDAARRIAQALLDRGLGTERPVTILSDNGIDHALLALGAMHAGVPVAPVSPAYSRMSKDFAKLRAICELLRPGLVYCSDTTRFAPALAAVGATATPIAALLDAAPTARVDEAFARIGPDTVAKILFTSGSTGTP